MTEEKVWSAGTIGVSAISSARWSPRPRDALRLLAVGDGVRRGGLVGGDRDLAVLLAERGVAEDVVEVLVGVHQCRPAAARESRRRSAMHLAGRLGRGVRVDDEQAGLALDHGDVDVVPLVARDPDPVADLRELRHVQRAYGLLVRLALWT